MPAPDPDAHRAAHAGAAGEQALGSGPDRISPAPELLHGPPNPDPLPLPAAAVHGPGHRDPGPWSGPRLQVWICLARGDDPRGLQRSSAAFPTAADTASTGGLRAKRTPGPGTSPKAGPRTAARSGAIHSCTMQWMTIPGSCTSEILPDETKETASAFMRNAIAAFAAQGVKIQRVLTDNGSCYRCRAFAAVLAEAGIRHKRTRPYRATNQWQGRTLQPHPARGMGLRQGLWLRSRTAILLRGLHRVLQSAQAPHRTQRRLTRQPRHQPTGLVHLAGPDIQRKPVRVFTLTLGPDMQHKGTRPYRPQTNGKVERQPRARGMALRLPTAEKPRALPLFPTGSMRTSSIEPTLHLRVRRRPVASPTSGRYM